MALMQLAQLQQQPCKARVLHARTWGTDVCILACKVACSLFEPECVDADAVKCCCRDCAFVRSGLTDSWLIASKKEAPVLTRSDCKMCMPWLLAGLLLLLRCRCCPLLLHGLAACLPAAPGYGVLHPS
jgi:hypothetical protein